MAIHECNMFMQGGASCHYSKFVSNFFKRKNIKRLDWPGNSADFNPIENLWEILKDKVEDGHPTSAKDLKMAIKHVWMQKRLQLIGGFIQKKNFTPPCFIPVFILLGKGQPSLFSWLG